MHHPSIALHSLAQTHAFGSAGRHLASAPSRKQQHIRCLYHPGKGRECKCVGEAPDRHAAALLAGMSAGLRQGKVLALRACVAAGERQGVAAAAHHARLPHAALPAHGGPGGTGGAAQPQHACMQSRHCRVLTDCTHACMHAGAAHVLPHPLMHACAHGQRCAWAGLSLATL